MHKNLPFVMMVVVLGFVNVAFAGKVTEKPIPKSEWSTLLKKLDQVESQGKDQKGLMELVLIDKAGKKRIRRAIFFQKGTTKRLVQFKYPASESGLTVLIRGKNIQIYLPQFRRIRRIAAHVKNQSFMGSDLSMDDMSTISYSKTHRILSASKLPNGGFRLLLKPLSGAYSKLEVLLRKDYLLKQILYFDKQGKAIKKMNRFAFRKVKTFLFPHRIVYQDLRTGHRTIVNMKQVSVNSGIPNKYFSRRYLKRELDL